MDNLVLEMGLALSLIASPPRSHIGYVSPSSRSLS